MKTTYILFFLMFMGWNLSAQKAETVKWYTIEEAQKLTEKEPRKILIDLYTDWCGWCKRMDNDTFNNPVIAEYINKNFYPVKFDAESKDPVVFSGHTFTSGGTQPRATHQFAMALFNRAQVGYPAIAYLTEKLELIGTVPGYKTPKQYEPFLHWIASDKFKEMTLEDYEKDFTGKTK